MTRQSKSLSKGGVYYLFYNVLNIAFPFITGIYVARKLLPATIGEVAAARNLAQYFVILSFLGIPTYGMREIAKARDSYSERSKIFSELYTINFFSTCIFLLFYLIVILLVPAYQNSLTLYIVVGLSIALNAFNISWLYEGLEEFQFISIRNLIFKAVAFVLLIILVRKPEDYLWYAGITVIGTAGNYIVNMLFAPKFVKISFRNLDIKRHLKPIFFLVAVNLAIELYSLVDVTMMNFLSSKESIAYYKYGHNIHLMLLQAINTFTMVLIPRISYYFKEKRMGEFNQLVSKALKLIIIVAVPMIIGIQFTANFLLVKMYGQQYINSAIVMRMLSILLLVSPIGYLLGSRILLVTNHENKMIISVGIGAIVNIIGNAILIPQMAEYGATIASILSELVVMVIYINLGKQYFSLKGIWNAVIKVLVASSIMTVYLFICTKFHFNGWVILLLQVVGSVVLYFVSLLTMKEEVTTQYSKTAINKLKQFKL